MAMLKPVDAQNATDSVKTAFERLERALGRVPEMINLMANSPSVLETYMHFNHALERTTLSPKTRALITVAIAEMNGCDYTLSLGMDLAKRQGVAEAELNAARLGSSHDSKTNDLLHFATSIVRNAGRVPYVDLERLRRQGVSDQEIVEVIAAVALNLFRNYFNLVAGTDIDSPVVRTVRSEQPA